LNDDNSNVEQLEDCRQSIDNLDSALIAILSERFRLTEKIGRMKAKGGFEASDPQRERVEADCALLSTVVPAGGLVSASLHVGFMQLTTLLRGPA
jgi:hypothetical protein